MTELSQKMRQLVEPWGMEVTVDGKSREQEFPPLVDMLRSRIVPDSNQSGGGGAVNTRNVLDVKSLDLLTNIEDVTRAWLQEWRMPGIGDLKADLRLFWNQLHTLHQSGALDDITFEHLAAYPDAWCVRIWDLIEPPMRVAVRGVNCPRCGTAKVENSNGDVTDNLLVLWRDGQEPTAECQQPDCAAIWVGDSGLEALGKEADLDIDVVALREWRLSRHAE